MKLYKGKIPVIAQELVTKLVNEGDVELVPDMRSEAVEDLASIMNNYLQLHTSRIHWYDWGN